MDIVQYEWQVGLLNSICFLEQLKNTKKEQTHHIPKSFQNLYRYLLYEMKI